MWANQKKWSQKPSNHRFSTRIRQNKKWNLFRADMCIRYTYIKLCNRHRHIHSHCFRTGRDFCQAHTYICIYNNHVTIPLNLIIFSLCKVTKHWREPIVRQVNHVVFGGYRFYKFYVYYQASLAADGASAIHIDNNK